MTTPYPPSQGLQHIGGAVYPSNPLIGGGSETTHMYIGGANGPVGDTQIVNTVAPAVTPAGATGVGTLLTSTSGAWTNSPTSYQYQWRRNGNPITSFGSGNTYTTQNADVGFNVDCLVLASNSASSALAGSNNIPVS